MFKVQTLNTIREAGLQQFPAHLYEVGTSIDNPDGILVRSHDMHHMKLADSIQVIGRAGAGVNTIPVAAFTKLGIPVLNTPGANANAVRELVIAGMLLASRNICQAWNYVRLLPKDLADMEKQIEQDKKQFAGFELLGKTLGVIGLGSIGVKVANAAVGLGMRIIGYDPTITVNRAWELSADVKQAEEIEHLLKEADFITFHVPLTKETKNMITAKHFHLMKKDVVLLNFARDGLIDKEALANALEEKKVFAYVNDFPSTQLMDSPRVISLPHLGASTREAEENCAIMIVKQMRDFLEHGTIIHSVNFPTVDLPQNKKGVRLGIVNANVPNMVAQISAKLGEHNMNITSLLNKSRDDMAYTIIDVDTDIDAILLAEIKKIQGVVRVRKMLPRIEE